MKLKEIVEEIRLLGFEDAEIATDIGYREIILSGISRAMWIISNTVSAESKELTIYHSSNAEQTAYDLKNYAPFEKREVFRIEKAVVKRGEQVEFEPRYKVVGSTLYLPKGTGEYRFTLSVIPELLTAETTDEHEIYMPAETTKLIALLASFYIWLDDDERKAQQYKNEYEDLKDIILAKKQKSEVGGFPETDYYYNFI